MGGVDVGVVEASAVLPAGAPRRLLVLREHQPRSQSLEPGQFMGRVRSHGVEEDEDCCEPVPRLLTGQIQRQLEGGLVDVPALAAGGGGQAKRFPHLKSTKPCTCQLGRLERSLTESSSLNLAFITLADWRVLASAGLNSYWHWE